MSAPWRVNDGDWRTPLLVKDSYSFPFSDRGDGVSFEYARTERFDRNVQPRHNVMDALNTARGICYLVQLGNIEDQGEGIYEQENVYASIPASRSEAQSMAYTYQWWRATIGDPQEHGFFYPVNFEIAEQTFTVSASIQYEYFANFPPKPLTKPRVFTVFETLYSIGGLPPNEGRLVAEDSEVTLYKGRIWQRRTPYVTITPRKAVPMPT